MYDALPFGQAGYDARLGDRMRMTPERPTPDAVNAMVAESFPGARDRCAQLGTDWALARRDVGPDDIRPGDYVSGPVQFGIADAALWYLSFAVLGRIEPMAVTAELSLRYLRPAQGGVLWARARLESVGRRQLVGSARVWVADEGRPTAVAQGTYVFPSAQTTPG